MPKEITHLVVADEVLASLPREVRDRILPHRHLYDIGSTSPDLFYYDVPFPFEIMASAEVFSERIHGRSGEDNAVHVLWMLDEIKKSPLEGGLAFLAGYLTHTASDAVFHPMVYSLTGNYFAEDPAERKRARARHRVLETSLDLYLLERRGVTLAQFNLPGRMKLNKRDLEVLTNLYARSLRIAFDPEFPLEKGMQRVLRKFRWMTHLMVSASITRLLHSINRIAAYAINDFANLFYPGQRSDIAFATKKKTPHPVTGRPYDRDIETLMKRSVRNAVRNIQAAARYLDGRISRRRLARLLLPLSLNNGLPRTPVSAMKHYGILEGIERFDRR